MMENKKYKQQRKRVPDNQMPFGDSIKEIRKREGAKRGLKNKRGKPRSMSQPELADELNVSLDSVKNWEQHYNVPEMETLLRICDQYQCDLDWLFGRIKERSHDIKAVADITGLNEDAINNLMKTDIVFIQQLLLSDHYETSTELFEEYLDHVKDMEINRDNIKYQQSIYNDPKHFNYYKDDPHATMDWTIKSNLDSLKMHRLELKLIEDTMMEHIKEFLSECSGVSRKDLRDLPKYDEIKKFAGLHDFYTS